MSISIFRALPRFAALAVVSSFVAVGCAAPTDGAESVDDDAMEETGSSESELNSGALNGRVIAYATTSGSNTGAKQVFGPGTYLANAGELSGVGNDQTRLFEVGPAMAVRACPDETSGVYACSYFQNLTGSNKTFPIAIGTSKLEVRPLVVAYRDANFSGVAQGFAIGRYDTLYAISTVGNDTISSLRVAPGLTVRLCSDNPETTVGGSCVTHSGNVSQLSSTIADRGSWLEVKPRTTLFRDTNFGGVSQNFSSGTFQVGALSIVGNDTASSIVVGDGVQTRICSDDPYATVGGSCGTFTKSSTALSSSIDNRTSFIESRETVILSPGYEDYFGGPVTLRGYANSRTTSIPAANLRWYSNRDGFLGTGAVLTVNLSKSTICESSIEHIITLTATDANGVQFSTTRRIYNSRVC